MGVTFNDVGGADEAIAELREIIQFLKTPDQFSRLGGKIPKGVLLVGPPGTGKTLIAKATAGEAHVPFFETSGSEFVEMFVGVGAARVRDLFEQARQVAPAIVFIDEIDAIGQSRGAAIRVMTNDEREQTLNQLLAEIDGFKADTARPVIIMAATNRPEILDPALLRAGRFDRQVTLGNPDLIGRVQILKIHTRHITLASDFDVERAARLTPGASGADLANFVNEAALLAARRQADAVTLNDFEAAMERIVAGLENRTRVMNEQERRTVAFHECGHALMAHLVPHGDPVSKISIVPRSRGALGYTLQMPKEDRYLLTVEELEDRLAVMLGGRAAELIVFNTISTGATDDIQRATELARRMVTEYGMSEKLGSVRYAGQQLRYLAGALSEDSQLSLQTRDAIDGEVQRIIGAQYESRAAVARGSPRGPRGSGNAVAGQRNAGWRGRPAGARRSGRSPCGRRFPDRKRRTCHRHPLMRRRVASLSRWRVCLRSRSICTGRGTTRAMRSGNNWTRRSGNAHRTRGCCSSTCRSNGSSALPATRTSCAICRRSRNPASGTRHRRAGGH